MKLCIATWTHPSFYCYYYVEKKEKKESTTNDKSAGENIKTKEIWIAMHTVTEYTFHIMAILILLCFAIHPHKCYDYPFHEYK